MRRLPGDRPRPILVRMDNTQKTDAEKQATPPTPLPGLPGSNVPAVHAPGHRPPDQQQQVAIKNPMPPNYGEMINAMTEGRIEPTSDAAKAVIAAMRPQAAEFRNLLQHIAQSEQALANAQQMRLRLEGALNAQTALVWEFENPTPAAENPDSLN